MTPAEVARLDAWLDPEIGLWVRWTPTNPADVSHYRSFAEPQLAVRQLIAINAHGLPEACQDPQRGPLHRDCGNRFDLGLPDACYMGGVGDLDDTARVLRPTLLVLDPFVRLHRVDENVSGAARRQIEHGVPEAPPAPSA